MMASAMGDLTAKAAREIQRSKGFQELHLKMQ